MKLLISDYDNTFHIEDCNIYENLKKVEEFRKDNLFVIATGRSYESYKSQEQLFDIKTDYLIINHGATILKNDNIIYNKPIDDSLKQQLLKDLQLDKSDAIYCYKGKESVEISEDGITKILIEYKDHDTAIKIRNLIKDKYKDVLQNFHFTTYNSVEIVSADVDKSIAITVISKIENPDNIYVIGDNHNDYLMIKNYNGVCTSAAIEEVKQIANKIYENVSDYIEDISKEYID